MLLRSVHKNFLKDCVKVFRTDAPKVMRQFITLLLSHSMVSNCFIIVDSAAGKKVWPSFWIIYLDMFLGLALRGQITWKCV